MLGVDALVDEEVLDVELVLPVSAQSEATPCLAHIISRGRIQQIVDSLVIDLEVRAGNRVLTVSLLIDLLKQGVDGPRDQTHG